MGELLAMISKENSPRIHNVQLHIEIRNLCSGWAQSSRFHVLWELDLLPLLTEMTRVDKISLTTASSNRDDKILIVAAVLRQLQCADHCCPVSVFENMIGNRNC